jgi:two-component system response regulator FixJ
VNASELAAVFGMKPQEACAKLELLSPREAEVAELMAMGLGNTQIANKLEISRKTLDIHRGKVKRKLQTTIQGIGRIWFLCKLFERQGT